jgi:hypothetical protein
MFIINKSSYRINPGDWIICERRHTFYFLVGRKGGRGGVNYTKLFVSNKGLNSENTLIRGTNLFTMKASCRPSGDQSHVRSASLGQQQGQYFHAENFIMLWYSLYQEYWDVMWRPYSCIAFSTRDVCIEYYR